MTYEQLALLAIGILVGFMAGTGWGYSAGLQRQLDGKGGKHGRD